MAGHVAHMRDMQNYIQILAGKPEAKRQLGRYTHRREDNTEIDLRAIRWESADWIHLAQDRDQSQALVNKVMKF
jgi:hypothetical protein